MIHPDAERLLAAGAALDDLAPDERAAYERHAAGCTACRGLEGELAAVLADLALVVEERQPPADLLTGIRHAIAAEDERMGADAYAAPRITAPDGSRPRRIPLAAVPESPSMAASALDGNALPPSPQPIPLPTGRDARGARRVATAAIGIAAALAIVAVGLGVRTAGLQDELDRAAVQVTTLRAQVSDQGGVVAAGMNPQHVTVALHAEPLAPRATATVVFVPGTTSAYLVAQDLPATPSGHGYQLWYADDAGVHPLQTVSYDGQGPFVAPLDVDLGSSVAVMITLEESGGSTGEPGPQVVFGEI